MCKYNFNLRDIINRVTILLFIFVIASCSDKNTADLSCDIAADTVSIIDSIKIDDTTYYLVYRISGWSDKTEILELYNSKPVFDNCSRSNVEPIYGDSLEMERIISHVYFNRRDKKLEITYVPGIPGKSHNANLKIELKE